MFSSMSLSSSILYELDSLAKNCKRNHKKMLKFKTFVVANIETDDVCWDCIYDYLGDDFYKIIEANRQ